METEVINNTEDQKVPNSPFGFGVDGDKASTSSRKFNLLPTRSTQLNQLKSTKWKLQ